MGNSGSCGTKPEAPSGGRDCCLLSSNTRHDFLGIYLLRLGLASDEANPHCGDARMDGVPEEPKSCQVTNRTSDCIYLGCESGEDGGLQQIFQIEVMSTDSDKFLANLTARNSPNFIVCSLPPKESFILVVYAINSKGRSKQVTIHTSTLPGLSKEKDRWIPQGVWFLRPRHRLLAVVPLVVSRAVVLFKSSLLVILEQPFR
ncbi:uncharacterized protein TNCV_5069181 [Trichonephila clavipes]|nr:uncharacterized protein TNCV_5069181 [Trichonephila clavipes]